MTEESPNTNNLFWPITSSLKFEPVNISPSIAATGIELSSNEAPVNFPATCKSPPKEESPAANKRFEIVASSSTYTLRLKDTSPVTNILFAKTASFPNNNPSDAVIASFTKRRLFKFASFVTFTPCCNSPVVVITWWFVIAVTGITSSWKLAEKKPFTVKFLHSNEADVVTSWYKNNCWFTNALPLAVKSFATMLPEV